ncbi:MAG: PTS sugar transporter subunit IIB [Erysipelotrichaceae bacterium]|nr:PTS sugar transporter subunit IIB [Erysipelotrichaceae bacterium]
MAIVDVRIDDRLIHGQVCGYWIPHYQVDRIVIVDNEIEHDSMRKTALKFGCPPKVALAILSASSAAEKFKRHLDKGSKVMILCSGPKPLLEMVEAGFTFPSITVGNMSSKENTKPLKRTLFISPEDKVNFEKLAQHGIKLYSQMTPSDTKEDFSEMIKSI